MDPCASLQVVQVDGGEKLRTLSYFHTVDPRKKAVFACLARRTCNRRPYTHWHLFCCLRLALSSRRAEWYCRLNRTMNADFPPPEKNCIQVHAVFLRRRKVRVHSSIQTTVSLTIRTKSSERCDVDHVGMSGKPATYAKRPPLVQMKAIFVDRCGRSANR